MDYLVEWAIDVEADTPYEAAVEALIIQRDPTSIATVFVVDGVSIDLEDLFNE